MSVVERVLEAKRHLEAMEDLHGPLVGAMIVAPVTARDIEKEVAHMLAYRGSTQDDLHGIRTIHGVRIFEMTGVERNKALQFRSASDALFFLDFVERLKAQFQGLDPETLMQWVLSEMICERGVYRRAPDLEIVPMLPSDR